MPRPRRTQVSLGTAYQLKRVCAKSGYQRDVEGDGRQSLSNVLA